MSRLDVYSLGALELQLELKNLPVRIGRSSSCEIRLNELKVSREHAEIRPSGDGFLLVNHSQYGTRVNSELEKGERPLHYGDRLYFGERFAIVLAKDASTAEPLQTILPGY